MANAKIDENGRQSMIGVLNTDGKTITRVVANSATNYLHVNDDVTGTNLSGNQASTDENGRTTMFALASDGSGTYIALNVDSTGALLTKST